MRWILASVALLLASAYELAAQGKGIRFWNLTTATTGNFSNAGNVTIGANSTLTVGGTNDYTQTSGSTLSRWPYCSLSCAQAMVSGLPPRRMSVPRPAMLVAIVTDPERPAWATMSASRSSLPGLALRT